MCKKSRDLLDNILTSSNIDFRCPLEDNEKDLMTQRTSSQSSQESEIKLVSEIKPVSLGSQLQNI